MVGRLLLHPVADAVDQPHRTLGRAALRLLPRSRQRIRTHLGIAFPELEESRRDDLVKNIAHHFGQMLAEVATDNETELRLAVAFLIGLPLLLLIVGAVIWLRRRRR